MPDDRPILEGIVTTVLPDGSPNIAPMGPRISADFQTILLRPFQPSTTYDNLKRTGQGVFHVTDDVELLARAAIGRLESLPPMRAAESLTGWILADVCRWYAFRVESLDDSRQRAEIECRVVESGRQRDFFGFNRAMFAVVEAAILATRIELLPANAIAAEYQRLAVIVEKTAGPRERRAFNLLVEFVRAGGVDLASVR
ncbi:MAG: DUF447 domain-containing protein [Pirellulales bacterium]